MTLQGKQIVLGVSGGIAAFKAVTLCRELQRRGATVRVILTEAGARFVGAVTFTGLTGEAPVTDLWDPSYPGEIHVELAAWADAMVVAPATANLMLRASQGGASDALSTTLLCFQGPKFFAPAMHSAMWEHPATQRNAGLLRDAGATLVGPTTGMLASGESGVGRMLEPAAIADIVEASLGEEDWAGRRLLVTAGPTFEDLDPVRFLGNRSSGKMGFAIARCAQQRGAQVTLIHGPVSLAVPRGVSARSTRSAQEMHDAVMQHRDDMDVIVMAAAVADYRPAQFADDKIKKNDGPMSLNLVRNPDILRALGEWRNASHPVLVGFAVETRDVVASARRKLISKNVDLVVANEASVSFGRDTNRVTLVERTAETPLPELAKEALADRILDRVRALLDAPSS